MSEPIDTDAVRAGVRSGFGLYPDEARALCDEGES